MKCPKCGYHRQDKDNAFTPATECPACGIVYSKHVGIQPASTLIGAAPPPHLRPSPVAAVSLLKAKDRVEKRLRKQLESNIKDQRHEATLKLARHIADQEIRRRQEHWEKLGDASIPEDNDLQLITQMLPPDGTAASEAPVLEAEAKPHVSTESMDQDATQQASSQASAAEVAPEERPEGTDVEMQTIILESSETASSDTAEGVSQEDAFTEKEQLLLGTPSRGKAYGKMPGSGMMRLLPSIAWLMLVCGIIGAFLSWTTISDVEAGVSIPVPSHLSSLPLGLLLGFAYLATGALGFAFFWVSSLINRQLKDIRRLLLTQPMSQLPLDEFAVDPSASLPGS